MTPAQWKKIARLLKEAYKELEQEAIKAGVGVTSPEFESVMSRARELILEKEGFTMEEYEMAGHEVKESRQKKEMHHTDTMKEIFTKVEGIKGNPGEPGHTPTDEELIALIKPLIPKPIPGESGKTPTKEELLALIKPLIPQVKNGETPSDERLVALITPLIPDITGPVDAATGYLEEKISQTKREIESKIPKEEELSQKIEEVANVSFKKNIDIMGMPDFRKLSMGLQGQIDEVRALAEAGSSTTSNSFETLSVSGQSNVVADSATDTLTLVAGTGMTITTNAATDTITFSAATESSGIVRTVVVTSGSATMGSSAATDYVYFVAGAHVMSLPAASGNTNRYTVKNNHSANITVNTAGAENIEGAASIAVAPGDSVDIISDGTNWFIV